MVRMFQTHKIRKTTELSNKLWDFSAVLSNKKKVTKKLFVPGCWESDPELITHRGAGQYRTQFEAAGTIRLEFKAVAHFATIFLDEKKIASHYNAYTPFSVIQTVEPGMHELIVEADNSFTPESALHVENDYQSYGGIPRPVVLEELGNVLIKSMHITTKKNDKWRTDWSVTVENLTDKPIAGTLVCSIEKLASSKKEVLLAPNETKEIFVDELVCPDADEWNPDTPNLYQAEPIFFDEQGVAVDDLIDRIGFREVIISGKDILLNGKKLLIKGLCRHEDHPQFGSALPVAAIQQDLAIIKDLGANSVRTSHYPNDELFLDLCDEQGILVWEENHARGLSEEQMRNPNFERQCEDCIREMIEAHYNHPCIYIWGILNECASHTEYGKDCYEKQLALIHSLDPSRPRSFASCQFKTDICFGIPDVVSYNIYPLWYHDTPPKDYLNDLYQWVQNETGGAGKPFLVTEIGAGGIYGYRTPAKVKWSEEYQAETLEKQLRAVFSQEGCSGVYIWQYCDCRVCDSWFGGRPRTMNNKGIVDEYRRPKLAYEVVKKIFRETV